MFPIRSESIIRSRSERGHLLRWHWDSRRPKEASPGRTGDGRGMNGVRPQGSGRGKPAKIAVCTKEQKE